MCASVEIYVFFCEQFDGHIVDGFYLLFEDDGLEEGVDTGITLHIGMLGDEEGDATLFQAGSIFFYHVVAHDLYVSAIGMQEKFAYEVGFGVEGDAVVELRMGVEEVFEDDRVFLSTGF